MPSSSPVIRNEIEPLGLPPFAAEMIERRGDLAGDRALHVDGAAAVQHAVGDVGRERRVRPRLGIARRHHVGVAGEHQMRRAGADAGVEVLDVGGARLGERHAMHGEARALQHAFRATSARRPPPASPTGSAADRGRWRRDRAWSKFLRKSGSLENVVRGVAGLGRSRHRDVTAVDRTKPYLVTAFARSDETAAVGAKNCRQVPVEVGHYAPARSRCSSALNVSDSLSLAAVQFQQLRKDKAHLVDHGRPSVGLDHKSRNVTAGRDPNGRFAVPARFDGDVASLGRTSDLFCVDGQSLGIGCAVRPVSMGPGRIGSARCCRAGGQARRSVQAMIASAAHSTSRSDGTKAVSKSPKKMISIGAR